MRYLSAFRAAIRQKLRDEFATGVTPEWADDEIDAQVQLTLEEFSQYVPCEVIEPLYLHEDSREIDISGIVAGLVEIKRVEYPLGDNPPTFIRFSQFADSIYLDITAPSDADHGVLTGTVTFTHASETVTGAASLFTTELEAGEYICISSGNRWYEIESIESATSLTLTEDYLGTTAADTVTSTLYAEAPVYLYTHQLHSITETASTLRNAHENILIKGICGQLAVNKARDVMDSVNLGGASVARELQNWGLNELYDYRKKLNLLVVPKQKTEWQSL